MIKKTFFLNTIALGALLFSCLQLHAMGRPPRISDGITNLRNAVAGRIDFQDVWLRGRKDPYKVRYTLLGAARNRRGQSNIYMIQLPSYGQGSTLFCGAYAYENCKVLMEKNLGLQEAVEELKNLNTKGHIDERRTDFGENVNIEVVKGRFLAESNLELKSTVLGSPAQEEQELPFPTESLVGEGEYGGLKMIDEDRFKFYNSEDYAYVNTISTMGINDSRIIFARFGENLINEFKDGRDSVEVFFLGMLKFGAHYVAVRVEKMENGDIAILFADSLYPDVFSESMYFKKEDCDYYKEAFASLIRSFGYQVTLAQDGQRSQQRQEEVEGEGEVDFPDETVHPATQQYVQPQYPSVQQQIQQPQFPTLDQQQQQPKFPDETDPAFQQHIQQSSRFPEVKGIAEFTPGGYYIGGRYRDSEDGVEERPDGHHGLVRYEGEYYRVVSGAQ